MNAHRLLVALVLVLALPLAAAAHDGETLGSVRCV